MEFTTDSGFEMPVPPVVLDIGMDYTKVGFSKEAVPWVIIKTPLSLTKEIREKDDLGTTLIADMFDDQKALKYELEEFLKEIFVIHGNIKTEGHTVCVGEQLIFPRSFMQALSEVLFTRFEISNVYFFLSNILPLYTTGLNSGLIVDGGYLHTSISAVAHTIFSIRGNIHSFFGGAKLEHRVKSLLKEDNKDSEELVTTKLVQDIIAKSLKVLTREQMKKFFETEENIQKMKSTVLPLEAFGEEFKEIRISYYTMVAGTEMFFTQSERSEDVNLAWLIGDSLLQQPVSNRVLVLQNLIFTGGLFFIPNFRKRLLQELEYAFLNVAKYSDLKGLGRYIKVEKCIYPPNVLVWIGASLLSCLNQEIDTFLITKKEFEDELKSKLPDRFGHGFVTCSRETEVESDEEAEDAKEDSYYEKKFTTPETKRDLNYFNKDFEKLNKMRKETLYKSATPYGARVGGRQLGFHFPS